MSLFRESLETGVVQMPEKKNGWIGFDLDGTIAHYDGWKGVYHIGQPIPSMIERIKSYLQNGYEVRIMTARVCNQQTQEDIVIAREAIEAWTQLHVGQVLAVTNEKDFKMIHLYDDRCRQVIENTGVIVGE